MDFSKDKRSSNGLPISRFNLQLATVRDGWTACPPNKQFARRMRAVWDSSIVMAKYLEHHPGMLKGRSLCDVSAGTGLVGMCPVASHALLPFELICFFVASALAMHHIAKKYVWVWHGLERGRGDLAAT
jgi:Lysine methyltransferase